MTKTHAGIAEMAFSSRSKDAFSYFLDFALFETQSFRRHRTDLYTFRILEQILPPGVKDQELASLGHDFSARNIQEKFDQYLPDYLIRTEQLNQDFHSHVGKGNFQFMNLKQDWKEVFTIDAEAINQSSASGTKRDQAMEYFNPYHLDLLSRFCQLPKILHDMAGESLR